MRPTRTGASQLYEYARVRDLTRARRLAYRRTIRTMSGSDTRPTRPLEFPGVGHPGAVRPTFADDRLRAAGRAHRGGQCLHDGIPYLPTAADLQIEMEVSRTESTSHADVVSSSSRAAVARAGVERVTRDDEPSYDIWGSVDPGAPASWARLVAPSLDARASRASGQQSKTGCPRCSAGSAGGHEVAGTVPF